jgi:hypothetical protein
MHLCTPINEGEFLMGKKSDSGKKSFHRLASTESTQASESGRRRIFRLSDEEMEATAEAVAEQIEPVVQAKRDLEQRLGLRQFWGDSQAMASAEAESATRGTVGLSNVLGVDVGLEMVDGRFTGDVAVRMFVKRKVDESRIAEGKMETPVAGVKTDVIEVGDAIFAEFDDPRNHARPAKCGASAGHSKNGNGPTGTIGYVCIANRTNNYCILSNTHVFANANHAAIGDTIIQPGVADGGRQSQRVGKLEDFIPLQPGSGSTVDAAIAFSAPELVSPEHFGFVIDPRPLRATLGMWVKKVGRTTGRTTGRVTGVQATINVTFQPVGAPPFNSVFVNQISIVGDFGFFSEAGDSGSGVVEAMSNRPVGLHFAGSQQSGLSFSNPIHEVIDALDIEIIGSLDGFDF